MLITLCVQLSESFITKKLLGFQLAHLRHEVGVNHYGESTCQCDHTKVINPAVTLAEAGTRFIDYRRIKC